MTVRVNKPAVNLREELASLRNQGGYSEQQFYFDGLVTNGTFDADTDWSKGTGWTISAGGLHISDETSSSVAYNTGGAILSPNTTYVVTFTISNSTANFGVRLRLHNSSGTSRYAPGTYYTADGTYTVTIPAGSFTAGDALVGFYRNGSHTGGLTIDNVSAFETDGTDVIHTMPKGWVPKDVFEDGLLQREGAAHDYEVVYDDFDYKIKPTVAPSATTQTCVIGVKA